MKPYTNKTDKVDARKCLYSEIKGNDKARKKATRRDAKKATNEWVDQCFYYFIYIVIVRFNAL